MKPKQYMIISGAMSGTSMDGIDWVTVQIRMENPPLQIEFLHGSSIPYPAELRQLLFDVVNGKSQSVQDFFRAEELVTDFYRESFREHQKGLMIKPEYLSCHGQTIYHNPDPVSQTNQVRGTWQLLNGQRLAAELDIPVIFRFRQADLAAGGQGAPLVPKVDELLFSSQAPCAVLNIGGIANLTLLAENEWTSGFDCGPGNIILDYIANRFFSVPFDADGKLAATGTVFPEMIKAAMADPFFKKEPPKSTGRELFSEDWIENWLDLFPAEATKHDFLATAAELTAQAIYTGVKKYSAVFPKRLYASGGGTRNLFLMERISAAFKGKPAIQLTDEAGVSAVYKEAIAFAVLGFLRTQNQFGNLPKVTGARKPVKLGLIAEP